MNSPPPAPEASLREAGFFVAFGGWDAAGAKLFGYPTFWVNRLCRLRKLGAAPDGIGENLTDW